jgi:hypothetical protein
MRMMTTILAVTFVFVLTGFSFSFTGTFVRCARGFLQTNQDRDDTSLHIRLGSHLLSPFEHQGRQFICQSLATSTWLQQNDRKPLC